MWIEIIILDYSRVEANPPHPNIKVEAVAHEVWLVRSAPEGKKMSIINENHMGNVVYKCVIRRNNVTFGY